MKTDIRVVKTQKALVEALKKLIAKNTFEEITVQMICDESLVRRATFYDHFANKYELFSFSIQYIYKEFTVYNKLKKQMKSKELYFDLLEEVINFFSENAEFVKSIIKSNLSTTLISIIFDEIRVELKEVFEKDNHIKSKLQIESDILTHFYSTGLFSVALWWMKNDKPISKEELISQLRKLILY